MSVALPVLFGLVGIASIAVIWHTVASNIGAIADLRRQIMSPALDSGLIVNFREQPIEFDIMSGVRRPRQVRVPAPKPVTHRLHQFTKARTAA